MPMMTTTNTINPSCYHATQEANINSAWNLITGVFTTAIKHTHDFYVTSE